MEIAHSWREDNGCPMNAPRIRAENISKMYYLGEHRPLRDIAARVFGVGEGREKFWALNDISFDVADGECVGIIGPNGAGKSTLLKVLSRITAPTTGTAKLNGRVGSLLEVGTGFNPELTGRENVLMNGAILGMRQDEVKARFDEIVDFAEVEKFIDTPVKWYSSGMRLRLAFAVAAHLEPEILIVDEVLAVGDMSFQQKCLGKIDDMSSGGRTVLFVSHNLSAVRRLCSRAIVLDQGTIFSDGDVGPGIENYRKLLGSGSDISATRSFDDDGTCDGFIDRITVTKRDQMHPCDTFSWEEEVDIEFGVTVRQPSKAFSLILLVDNAAGDTLFYLTDDHTTGHSSLASAEAGHYAYRVTIPKKILREGTYYVTAGLMKGIGGALMKHLNAVQFTVRDSETFFAASGRQQRRGAIMPDLSWGPLKPTAISGDGPPRVANGREQN